MLNVDPTPAYHSTSYGVHTVFVYDNSSTPGSMYIHRLTSHVFLCFFFWFLNFILFVSIFHRSNCTGISPGYCLLPRLSIMDRWYYTFVLTSFVNIIWYIQCFYSAALSIVCYTSIHMSMSDTDCLLTTCSFSGILTS